MLRQPVVEPAGDGDRSGFDRFKHGAELVDEPPVGQSSRECVPCVLLHAVGDRARDGRPSAIDVNRGRAPVDDADPRRLSSIPCHTPEHGFAAPVDATDDLVGASLVFLRVRTRVLREEPY